MRTILIEPGFGIVNTRIWELYNPSKKDMLNTLRDKGTKPIFNAMCAGEATEAKIVDDIIKGKVHNIVIEGNAEIEACYLISYLKQKQKAVQYKMLIVVANSCTIKTV